MLLSWFQLAVWQREIPCVLYVHRSHYSSCLRFSWRLLNSCAEPPAEPESWVGGRQASPGTERYEGESSSVMAELSRSSTDGQKQDCLAKDNPDGDRGNAEKGLDPGGRAVTHYLATAARQQITVPPQHSFSPLSRSLFVGSFN